MNVKLTEEELEIVLGAAWRDGYEEAMKDFGITEEEAVKKL
jgi:hypothetical protein